jgi:hypothetical protein
VDKKHFARGDLLFNEGSVADRVFRVRSGAIDVVREVGGQIVLMGTLGAGQFVGEMAAIERRPRHSATARAASNSEVDVLTLGEFLDQLDHSPGVARNLIERLSWRIHVANERILHDEAHTDAQHHIAEASAQSLSIAAGSPWLLHQMPNPIAVSHLPFVVGRRSVAGERPARQRQDLLLDDHEPFRLSRDHFVLMRNNDHYVIRDMGSTLGTVVNGEPIGEHFRKNEVLLHDGENQVVAGGEGSRFSFLVSVG